MGDWIPLLIIFSGLSVGMAIMIIRQHKDLKATKAVLEDIQNGFKELNFQIDYQQYLIILLEQINALSLGESDNLPETLAVRIEKNNIEYPVHLKDFWKNEEHQIKDYLRSQFPDLTNDMFEQFIHILNEYFKK